MHSYLLHRSLGLSTSSTITSTVSSDSRNTRNEKDGSLKQLFHNSYLNLVERHGKINITQGGSINSIDSLDNTLISGGGDGVLGVYQHSTGMESKLKLHQYGISKVLIYPDGGMYISSSYDKTIKIIDATTLQSAATFTLTEKIYSISQKDNLIASCQDRSDIQIVDMRSGSSSHVLSAHKGAVLSLHWHPLRSLLFSGGTDGTVRIWDPRFANPCLCSMDSNNMFSATSTAHSGSVNSLAISKDGLHLVSGGLDEKIRLWDLNTGKNLFVDYGPLVRNGNIQSLQSLIYKNTLFWPNNDGRILILNLKTGGLINKLFTGKKRVCAVIHRYWEEGDGGDEFLSCGLDKEIHVYSHKSIEEKEGDERERLNAVSIDDVNEDDEGDEDNEDDEDRGREDGTKVKRRKNKLGEIYDALANIDLPPLTDE